MTIEDTTLYARNADSLLASWEINASASRDARVARAAGVAAAVFPMQPERAVYNNALFERGLNAAGREHALDAMAAAYASAGIPHFAAWVHESDPAMRRALEESGYVLDPSTTIAMGMALGESAAPVPAGHERAFELKAVTWSDYLALSGLPSDFLHGIDQRRFQLLGAFADGELVSIGVSFDHRDNCEIYSLMTSEAVRRRGIGTAVTAALLAEAAARGCTTASVQATPMAQGVYAAAGFRDLGRFLEYVPPARTTIRHAQPPEHDALEALQRRSSLHGPMYRDQLAAHPDAIRLPAEQITAGLVRVAEQQGIVVGFAVLLEPAGDACELDGLFVDPDHMRAGVGRLLVDDAQRIARERRVASITVVANPQAVAFYEAVGFRTTGETQTRFGAAPRMSLAVQ